MSEPASQKQLDFIEALGGKASRNLSKEDASKLIDKLRSKVPATQKQLGYLKRLGASIPNKLTSEKARELIDQLDGMQPPTKTLIKNITELGGTPPNTKREAEQLYYHLLETAQATSKQHERAAELGYEFEEGMLYKDAEKALSEIEMDNDPENGKPPTKTQINKITKLGGDPEQVINRWRADEYIEQLEEQAEEQADEIEQRIEDVLDFMFGDPDSRATMSVKKPSKAVLKKALAYGDSQGWGPNWESGETDSEFNYYTQMDVAIYSVAPELLKNGEAVPELTRNTANHSQVDSSKKGCLSLITIIGSSIYILSRLVA